MDTSYPGAFSVPSQPHIRHLLLLLSLYSFCARLLCVTWCGRGRKKEEEEAVNTSRTIESERQQSIGHSSLSFQTGLDGGDSHVGGYNICTGGLDRRRRHKG